jgi:hypothetical protein
MKPTNPNRIDILQGENLSILLWSAIAKHIDKDHAALAPIKAARDASADSTVEVMGVIAGVQFPILPALEQALEQLIERANARATETAIDMIEEAYLAPLNDTLLEARKTIRTALAKIGGELPDQDY